MEILTIKIYLQANRTKEEFLASQIDLAMMKAKDLVKPIRTFIIKFILLIQKLLDHLISMEMEC